MFNYLGKLSNYKISIQYIEGEITCSNMDVDSIIMSSLVFVIKLLLCTEVDYVQLMLRCEM